MAPRKNTQKHSIFFIGGENGGIGKSTNCRYLAHFFDKECIDFALVDADRSNSNVGIAYNAEWYDPESEEFKRREAGADASYPNFKRVYFTEFGGDSMLADALPVMAADKHVIVNLPSNVLIPFSKWVDDSHLLKRITPEDDFQVYYLSVLDPKGSGIQIFKDLLVKYPKMKHIALLNDPIGEGGWNKQSDFIAFLKKNKVTTIDVPCFKVAAEYKQILDRSKYKLSDMDKEVELPEFLRIRLEDYLEELSDNFSLLIPSPSEIDPLTIQ